MTDTFPIDVLDSITDSDLKNSLYGKDEESIKQGNDVFAEITPQKRTGASYLGDIYRGEECSSGTIW